MKKILLFVAIIAISLNISAQEQMYVWQNGTKTTFAIAEVDSITHDKNLNNVHEYVNLGLPSGLLWATCNVGASKPEEYGDYFAWGETTPKTEYSWETYKWCNGTAFTLIKYCTQSNYGTIDNKTILEPSDDAAVQNWGGDWRMPTKEDQDELLEKCTWTWTTQNGVHGYNVTSKSNGNCIFLPAAGGVFISETGSISSIGERGWYWSSSLYTSQPYAAQGLCFDSIKTSGLVSLRYDSYTVRPVCTQNTSVSKQMHVWRKGVATSFAIADVDSVTFDNSNSTSQNPSVQNGIGTFSVSATTQVTFSPGNLQYTQSTNTWSFASAQYEIIGTDNVIGGFMTSNPTYGDSRHGGDTIADKVDLFGWSTSATYFGVSTSTSNSHYRGSFVDWGTNTIGNDAPNTWRTLTYVEWYYLLYNRPNASSLKGVALVNGVNGLILLPDNWTCPAGVTFKSGFHSSHGMDYYAAHQTFTFEQWPKLESAGAVFLPAAGYRGGTFVDRVPGAGNYWSASTSGDNSNDASNLRVYSNEANMYPHGRYNGHSVRLVKNL